MDDLLWIVKIGWCFMDGCVMDGLYWRIPNVPVKRMITGTPSHVRTPPVMSFFSVYEVESA